jgi:hypothetical protein
MGAVIEAPVAMIEEIADLRLPPRADRRLQELMDRNNNGVLSASELEDMEALVELSETISIVRGQALFLLGRKP